MPFLASEWCFWPLTASTTSEAKINYAYVITQGICNNFIEVNFCMGLMVSEPNRLFQDSTTMSLINKMTSWNCIHKCVGSIVKGDSSIWLRQKGEFVMMIFLAVFCSFAVLHLSSIKNHFNSGLLFILLISKSDGLPKIQRKYRKITYLTCFSTNIVSEERVCTNYFPETLFS